MTSLPDSHAYCHQLMRSAARNFYFGMRLLPDAKRQAMHALYAFMRLIDDATDDADAGSPDEVRQNLAHWRRDLHAAYAGDLPPHPLWPAFADAARRFAIPVKVFDDAIDGQLQDLTQTTYATFDELYNYCYRVASTVGIASVHIWGYRDDRAIKLAEERGVALQLTNILRDVKEDAARGRRYLPAEDLAAFNLLDWDPAAGPRHAPPQVDEFLLLQTQRAKAYYDSSAPLDAMVDPDARPTLAIMTGIYRKILNRIARAPRSVLRKRVSVPTLLKLGMVFKTLCDARLASAKGGA